MKWLALSIGTVAILTQLAGCGADKPPASDYSDQPAEVREYEAKQAEAAKNKVAKPSAR